MEPTQRARYNANFTEEKYAALVRAVNETEIWPADFRISETPIFLTREFTREVETPRERNRCANTYTRLRAHAARAVPPGLEVPERTAASAFFALSILAICEGAAD